MATARTSQRLVALDLDNGLLTGSVGLPKFYGAPHGDRPRASSQMTGRKSTKQARKKPNVQQQANQQASAATQAAEDSAAPANIKKEQPPPPQTVKKIQKTENDEAKTLKTVFKSNPDVQIKEFIKKAAVKPSTNQQAAKTTMKTPADTHPPAVAQELLDTDDDVADNLAKLFKASKSYKDI